MRLPSNDFEATRPAVQTDASNAEGLAIRHAEKYHIINRTAKVTITQDAGIHSARVTSTTSTGIVLQNVLVIVVQVTTKVESSTMAPPPTRRMHRVSVNDKARSRRGAECLISKRIQRRFKKWKCKTSPSLDSNKGKVLEDSRRPVAHIDPT
jgi:hypothetical protein